MPKLGVEPIRRASLIKAAIAEIGEQGSLDVTVARIARRAGMSAALAHHYFGSKEAIFLAAMRHLLALYGASVRGALTAAEGPEGRARAIIRASFAPENFRTEVVAAWLNFYVLAQTNSEAKRLLAVYHRRLNANLRHALRPLLGARAVLAAQQIAALIDGAYLHAALSPERPNAARTIALIEDALLRFLAGENP